MSNGPDWPSIVAAGVAVLSGVVAVVLWVPKAIAASRHKAASDLQPKFESFDDDIDAVRKDGAALRETVADLRTRLAVVETKVMIESKLDRLIPVLERLAAKGAD